MDIEGIKKLIELADTNGWTKAEIARQIKTNRATLQALLDRDSPRSKVRPRLVRWLMENAHTIHKYPADQDGDATMTPKEASYVIADELIALAGVLRARELPEEYKASRLASWVIDAHRDLVGKHGKKD